MRFSKAPIHFLFSFFVPFVFMNFSSALRPYVLWKADFSDNGINLNFLDLIQILRCCCVGFLIVDILQLLRLSAQ